MNEKSLIGDVAQLFDISADTLRYYEKQGILAPKKDINGYRYYDMNEVIRMIDILFYRGMDMPIKDIATIINSMDIGSIIDVMAENEKNITCKIEKLQKLQVKLQCAQQRFIAADEKLGHCVIVAPPKLRYDLVVEMDHENIVELMNRYKKINKDWIDSLLFAIYLPREDLEEKLSFFGAKYGIIIEETQQVSSDLARTISEF